MTITKMSGQGKVALMLHEGIVPGPYRDSVNVWTFGIGHTAAAGVPDPRHMPRGMPADMDAALALVAQVFNADLPKYEAAVARAVKVPVNQAQFDALVKFHFNTGKIASATLTKTLNAGNYALAGEQFMNWQRPPELKARREAERDMFLHGAYPMGRVPVWQVSPTGSVIWKTERTLSHDQALNLINGKEAVAAPRPALAMGSRDPRNRAIQTILKGLGLYSLRLDDTWGPGQQKGMDALSEHHARIAALITGETT